MGLQKTVSILLLGCAIFGSGCFNSKEVIPDNSEQIVIYAKNTSDSVDVSHLIKEIKVILLNETDGNYIGEVDKVLLHRNNYIVLDKYVGKRVSVFDSLGQHVAKLGEIGRGPNELLQLNDIWINENHGVELYDFALKKIVTYDQNYSFIKYRKGADPVSFQSVSPIPGSADYLGFAGYNFSNSPYKGEHYNLAFLNNDFAVNKTALHFDAQLKGALIATPTNPFVRIGDSIRFLRNFDNFIYNISPTKSLSKRYALLYRPKPLPDDFETSILKENLPLFKADNIDFVKIQELYKGYFGFHGLWLETKKYVIFDSFDDNFHTFKSLYDKEKKEIIAQSRAFTDSVRYHLILPPAFTSKFEDNRFVTVFGGYILRGFITEKSPFFEIVNQNLDKNFVFDVTLK